MTIPKTEAGDSGRLAPPDVVVMGNGMRVSVSLRRVFRGNKRNVFEKKGYAGLSRKKECFHPGSTKKMHCRFDSPRWKC